MNYFHHSFLVNSSLRDVVAFHKSSDSLKQITPPPIRIEIHQSPKDFHHGEIMDFSLCIGPVPIRWTAMIENPSDFGFTDSQQKGPFSHWIHKHTFIEITPQTTKVVDEVQYTLRKEIIWYLVGKIMAVNLFVLFAYREWKTKRILLNKEGRNESTKS